MYVFFPDLNIPEIFFISDYPGPLNPIARFLILYFFLPLENILFGLKDLSSATKREKERGRAHHPAKGGMEGFSLREGRLLDNKPGKEGEAKRRGVGVEMQTQSQSIIHTQGTEK